MTSFFLSLPFANRAESGNHLGNVCSCKNWGNYPFSENSPRIPREYATKVLGLPIVQQWITTNDKYL